MQSHLRWQVEASVPSTSGRSGPCTPYLAPPFAARSLPCSAAHPITPGRGWLAAKKEEGRSNLLLLPRGPASAPLLALPPPEPACRGYRCHRCKRPRKHSLGGDCSGMGGRARHCPGLEVILQQQQRPGAPGWVKEAAGSTDARTFAASWGPSPAPGSLKGGNEVVEGVVPSLIH